MSDFLTYALKSLVQVLVPELKSICDETPTEFDSFEDVMQLYEGGIKLRGGVLSKLRDQIPLEMLRELIRTDGEHFLHFPVPDVIKGKTSCATICVYNFMPDYISRSCRMTFSG